MKLFVFKKLGFLDRNSTVWIQQSGSEILLLYFNEF